MLLPNLPPPEEGVRHRQINTQAFVNSQSLGTGTLYIAESRVSWAKDGGNQQGFSLQYPHIAIHAVSRDQSSFPHPCLYLMLDTKLEHSDVMTNGDGGSDSEEEEDEETAMTEIRFVPQDPLSLEQLYKNLSDCQLLHPDPEDQPSDDDDEGWPADVEEEQEDEEEVCEDEENSQLDQDVMEDDAAGRVGMRINSQAHSNGHVDEEEEMDVGQFEDAEM